MPSASLRRPRFSRHTALLNTTESSGIRANALFLKDLADKTRRGLRGRVEAGKSGGGNSYGCDVVKRFAADGTPLRGDRTINEAQAATVRRFLPEAVASSCDRVARFLLPTTPRRGATRPGRRHCGTFLPSYPRMSRTLRDRRAPRAPRSGQKQRPGGRCVRNSRSATVSDALQPAAQCRTRDGFERAHIGIDLRHAHWVGCPSGSGTSKGLEIVPNRGMRRD